MRVTTWTDPNNVMLSKISQTPEATSCMIPLSREMFREGKCTETENGSMVAEGWKLTGNSREVCTMTYMKTPGWYYAERSLYASPMPNTGEHEGLWSQTGFRPQPLRPPERTMCPL